MIMNIIKPMEKTYDVTPTLPKVDTIKLDDMMAML